jgi:hypothetical protein
MNYYLKMLSAVSLVLTLSLLINQSLEEPVPTITQVLDMIKGI